MGGSEGGRGRGTLNGVLLALTVVFTGVGLVGSLDDPERQSAAPTSSPIATLETDPPAALPYRAQAQRDPYWYVPNRAGSYHDGSPNLSEASGLVASKHYPGVFWFIRDGGLGEDRAKLYALEIDQTTGMLTPINGRTTAEFAVVGATNTDWEAITTDNDGNLWIGDIGDYYRKDDPDLPEDERTGQSRDRNNSDEPDLSVIRVPEPDPYAEPAAVPATVFPYRFPDGRSWNSEALIWLEDWLYVVTKDPPQRIYRFVDGPSTRVWDNTLHLVAEVSANIAPITGAALGDDSSVLAFTTASERAVVYTNIPTVASTAADADRLIASLANGAKTSWHYYYLDAAALAADGMLELVRPDSGPDDVYHRTDMQVEGVAFASDRLLMIAEYGRHVLSVPPTAGLPNWGWTDRPGPGE